ncbi:MAG: MFS transporter [Bacteroidetes bacterium]|nr:MFS transporter [Bacteroidota bacterium]
MKQRTPLGAIFLTVFLDMLGVGIIIPVLPALFMSPETSLLPPDTPHFDRSVLYGYLMAIYPAFQFFGAPILGALSDRYGRKPLLQFSLLGTLLGYLLFGWAILLKNLPLLFFSRALPGFTGGNISIVMSALSDIATPENRPKYFGLIGMAFGLGFILGPAIGGILADSTLLPWFSHATPFWFTAILTLLNILLVQRNFMETLPGSRESKLNLGAGFQNLRKAFESVNLRQIFVVSLLLSLGFSFYTQFYSVFLIQKFGIKEREIGLIFGWIGIWLAFTQGFTTRRLAKVATPLQVLRWSIPFVALTVALTLLPDHLWWMYLINPVMATFQGLTAPNLTTVVSTHAAPEEQGEIMGINQSMVSVGQIIPALAAGYLNTINGSFPILAGSLLLFAGWLVLLRVR